MRRRLNGWQRIGIVLSVIWAIGGGLWGNNIGIHEGGWVASRLGDCYAMRSIQPDGSVPRDTDWGPCIEAFHRDWPEAISHHWPYAAIVGLVPIPFAWLMVYALIGLWRWIRRGFNN